MIGKISLIAFVYLMTVELCFAQVDNVFPSTGNVGIGVPTPQEKLEVNGVVKLGGTAEMRLDANLNVQALNPGVTTLAASLTARKWGHLVIDMYSNDRRDAFAIRTDSDFDGTLDDIPFLVNAQGNVGIGTTNPQAKLAVEGTVLATEVKIKTDISVPDYVFEPDYNLPTLTEIEAHIKEHKHLPEIPSAANIQRDGLDVAEMNLLLLKKVEELTLHLIEKERQVQSMQAQLNQQVQAINEINSKLND